MNVIIIGGGQVGSHVGNLLLENGINIKIVDNRAFIIEKLKEELPPDVLYYGNGTDPNTLEELGIATADVLVAVAGKDEVNLVASTIAKFEFGVPRVVARVNNPRNTWLYNNNMGVDVCLNQADLMAHMVVEEMDMKNISTLMKLNKGTRTISKVTVDAQSPAATKKIKELNIPVDSILIAIYRKDEVIIPHGDTVINPDDQILFFADIEAEKSINTIFSA